MSQPCIFSLRFDLFPQNETEERLFTPYGYLFRGLIMKWINDMNKDFVADLHAINSNKFVLREYAIYTEKIQKKNPNGSVIQGRRLYLNIFQHDMMNIITNKLLKHRIEKCIVGTQQCLVSNITIRKIYPNNISHTDRSENSVQLLFKSPTAFNYVGGSGYVHNPTPERIFGSLLKIWNTVFQDTTYALPKNLYDKFPTAVVITKTDIGIKSWKMGKQDVKFKGFLGLVTISFIDDEIKADCYNLIKLGEFANVGAGRTAGFGHYVVLNTK
ncbi:CRISPR system precrRNA processing endoribonuclease RAMP protein Cas6 [candidate division KSB1 bacterium]|nr:CRISPR system precrRNA processing endoribonuclease RAMP protein Cas6 [candidate division KSB1 bacterium]